MEEKEGLEAAFYARAMLAVGHSIPFTVQKTMQD